MRRNLVVVCWDGKSEPLHAVQFDAQPQFDLLIFDFWFRDTFEGKLPEPLCPDDAGAFCGSDFAHVGASRRSMF